MRDDQRGIGREMRADRGTLRRAVETEEVFLCTEVEHTAHRLHRRAGLLGRSRCQRDVRRDAPVVAQRILSDLRPDPVAKKFNVDQLREQPLFSTNPEAALPLLAMIGQAQLSIDDLLGQLSRQFIEHMLVLSAQSVAGVQHKGRRPGEVRWHGSQSGVVRLGKSKMQVKRPRLRTTDGKWRFLPMPRWPVTGAMSLVFDAS